MSLKSNPSVAVFLLFSLCLAAISAMSATADQPPSEMTEAKKLYYRAVSGDESARKASAADFDRLAAQHPADPEVMAYRGSLILLEAGKTWAVWRKYELSKQGVVLLDDAVQRAPDDLELRFVRAATTRRLPAFFERARQSREDLTFLSTRVASAARNGQLDPALASASLYFYAKDVATGEQKTRALQQAAKIAPESQAGLEAAKALSGTRYLR